MISRSWVILVIALLVGVSGCTTSRGMNRQHAELVAWYIEDVVHGNSRSPDELIIPDSPEALSNIAVWLAGGDQKGERVQPQLIASRQTRWLALKSLFVQRQAVVIPGGLVAPAATLTTEQQRYVLPLIDAENQDRRALDAIIISKAKYDRDGAQEWLALSRNARVALDREAGATLWEGPVRQLTPVFRAQP